MNSLLRVMVVIACAARLAGAQVMQVAATDRPTVQEYAKFEGVWRFARVEVDGVRQPDMPFATNRLIISRDGSFTIVQGRTVTRGTVRLDPTKAPKHYDFTVNDRTGSDLTAWGIYEHDGDTFRICLSLRSNERPTDPVSKPRGCLFQEFSRERQDVDDALTEVYRDSPESQR